METKGETLFIKEVAKQLLPYFLREMNGENQRCAETPMLKTSPDDAEYTIEKKKIQ